MPLWDQRRALGRPLPEPEEVSGDDIHLPNPSYWPLVAAIGVAATIGSMIFTEVFAQWYLVTLGGAAILFYGVFSWAFEPAE
jgi:cytochrome c oxidase subunit 1